MSYMCAWISPLFNGHITLKFFLLKFLQRALKHKIFHCRTRAVVLRTGSPLPDPGNAAANLFQFQQFTPGNAVQVIFFIFHRRVVPGIACSGTKFKNA